MSLFGLQDRYFKYIYNENGKDEFYDLVNDPNELKNVISEDSEVKDKFKEEVIKKIDQFKEEENNGSLKFIQNDDATKYLESVGYFR